MYGYVEEGKKSCLDRRQLWGVWFLWATLPTEGVFCGIRRRRVWKNLRCAGTRCAVLPEELVEEAAQYGILPVEVASLRRALLPQMLDHFPPLEGKTATLCAPFLTPAVEAAGEELARRARYLRLNIGQGREMLAQRLYYRFGLTAGALGEEVLTVCFGGSATGRCLCLGEDCSRYQQVTYTVPILEAAGIAPREMLLSALFQGKHLPKEAICVKSISTKP
ncbi:MAG: hypothetical protein IJA33_02795 [Oscillospiraceae bacterium]|nr:hypothetical protein [Oscillospiraceae bacterium]